ncbi:glycosyltransferase family 4 protein [Pleomorphochaeta sp. DL1XJH-081]|uniref:glycosyltransferase family 4 protein n=1 Tax=Pleomorphochaeta sp. DL1XJH-081 TaxID=3409690 RepID=UPI003BB65950
MKRRVLFLVNHEVVIYNFRLELVERLLQDGHEVLISSPYGERIRELEELGCTSIHTTMDRHGVSILQDLKLLLHYRKILKQYSPSVVLTYTIKPNIYGGIACRMQKIPYIANITGLGTAVEKAGFLQSFTSFLYKHALKNAQKVFFQNKENQAFFEKKRIALGKHGLLPGSGVNLTKFQPLEYPPDDTIEFVFISRIMKEKGIDHYLEMAKVIKAKYPNTHFHICGFCEESYEGILHKMQEEGIIQYHGMVKDVREILRITHCTVHPSYYPEGLSNVLLESSACARPIITTDRSGCREVVEEGQNGFLIKIKDAKDLIAKVESFIALPYEKKKQMGIAGREKVEREFDRDIVVEKYLSEIWD